MQSCKVRFGKDSDAQLYVMTTGPLKPAGSYTRNQLRYQYLGCGLQGVFDDLALRLRGVEERVPPNTRFDATLMEDGDVLVLSMQDPGTGLVASGVETRALSLHLGFKYIGDSNGTDL